MCTQHSLNKFDSKYRHMRNAYSKSFLCLAIFQNLNSGCLLNFHARQDIFNCDTRVIMYGLQYAWLFDECHWPASLPWVNVMKNIKPGFMFLSRCLWRFSINNPHPTLTPQDLLLAIDTQHHKGITHIVRLRSVSMDPLRLAFKIGCTFYQSSTHRVNTEYYRCTRIFFTRFKGSSGKHVQMPGLGRFMGKQLSSALETIKIQRYARKTSRRVGGEYTKSILYLGPHHGQMSSQAEWLIGLRRWGGVLSAVLPHLVSPTFRFFLHSANLPRSSTYLYDCL